MNKKQVELQKEYLTMGLSTPTLVTCVRPEELSEGEFVNINKDNGCGKKHEDVQKKVTLAKSTTTKPTLTFKNSQIYFMT